MSSEGSAMATPPRVPILPTPSTNNSLSESPLRNAKLLEKVANMRQCDKQWREAGDAYQAAAKQLLIAGESRDAAGRFSNAARMYKKVQPDLAISALEQCLTIYAESKRYALAARTETDIAELYELDEKLDEAANRFIKSADLFDAEDQPCHRDKARLEAARLYALTGEYPKAAELFEAVAVACCSDSLRQFSVRDYLLRAGLCVLAVGDSSATHEIRQRYATRCFGWAQSRECDFLTSLIDAFNEHDAAAFNAALQAWDKLGRLNLWQSTVCTKIKLSMPGH